MRTISREIIVCFFLLAAAGCTPTESVDTLADCGPNGECNPGFTCDPGLHQCLAGGRGPSADAPPEDADAPPAAGN